MADSRDITGKNRKFTGTTGIKLPTGTEAQRVDEQAQIRFNTDTNLAEYYDGTEWKPIDSPPTILSVNPTSWTSDGSTIETFTVTGSNFQSGATAKFVGNDGTEYTSVNLNVVSSSSFTIQNMTTMGVAKEPYDIVFTNPSGLAATLEDAVDAGNNPSFTTAADTNVATLWEGRAAPFSETTLVATDSTDSQTVTHSISAGALPPGVTISSAGVLQGTVSGSSQQDYTFTVRASDGFNTVDRQFVITVGANPYIAATGGTVTESGDYKIHTFTGDGCFVVSSAGTPTCTTAEYLVVAGGGSGGSSCAAGGGGAGGYRTNYPSPDTGGFTLSVTTYPITVGGGASGVGPSPGHNTGQDGSNSVFSTITSTGGGGGGGISPTPNSKTGRDGGSGGGGSWAGNTSGSGNTPPVSPPQGNPGGNSSYPGPTTPDDNSGGGGGASAPGTPGNLYTQGGDGSPNAISGTATTYAGGGGGGSRDNPGAFGGVRGPLGIGQGGAGGGGGGGVGRYAPRLEAENGTANTGGGGGGANRQDPAPGVLGASGSGGSGIVIIRYKFQ